MEADAATAPPTPEPQSCGGVAFEGTNDGQTDIWSMGLDGSELVNLTRHPAQDRLPQWSPDGDWIAFLSDRSGVREIWVMNATGGNPRQVTSWPATPGAETGIDSISWSPDGSQLAYARTDDTGFSDIFVIGIDGQGQKQYTDSADELDLKPQWSPDGAWLAWVTGRGALWRMRPDGTAQERLTPEGDRDGDAVWSPDGRRIVIAAYSAMFEVNNREIVILNADGSQRVRVSNNPGDDRLPVWSPDGTRVAWNSERGPMGQKVRDLFVANADGSEELRVTNSVDPEYGVLWPTAETLLFVREERYASGATQDLYSQRPDSTEPRNLTARADISDGHPDVSVCGQ